MRTSERGMTLAEVLMSVAITGVLIFAMVAATSSSLQSTANNQDKQFAAQKALAMLEEMKALVQVNSGGTINVLDTYDDGSAYFNVLTIYGDKLADAPDSARSGNAPLGTGWVYSRQISVSPLTDPTNPTIVIGSQDCRLVRVRVYRNDTKGGHRLVAEVASVLRTLATIYSPSQVYDVYCVAAENAAGWWVNMGSIIPFVQNAIQDLQNRQPGLVVRQHWITKLAYGRDTQYTPFINSTNAQTPPDTPTPYPISYAYFYPGQLPTSYTPEAGGTAVSPPGQYYYPTPNIDARFLTVTNPGLGATPVVLQNGFVAATSPNPNPYPYALADQYNHAMRYYDELDLYNHRVKAVDGSGNLIYPKEEMTLRLLLDDMYLNPQNYTNAIVINLHGELLPFPPIRNYSDAAKKPDFYRGDNAPTPETKNGVRVVTHPAQLAYDTAVTPDVELRVYSYLTNPNNTIFKYPGGTKTCLDGSTTFPCPANKEYLFEPITIVLKGINWTPAQTATDFVRAISGGVDLDNSGARDAYTSGFAPNADSGPGHKMYYTRSLSAAGDTVIKLWYSPLVSPCLDVATPPTGVWCSAGGLSVSRRLYGLEYIPAPLEDFTAGNAVVPFQPANNLTATDDDEKNTARWILHIPASALGSGSVAATAIETRIGDYNPDATPPSFADGYVQQPPNLSRTYFWRGTNTWLYGNATTNPALPISERFQFQGDPRDCPYADLKMPHNSNSNAFTANTNLGMGYNRYFDDFENSEGNMTKGEYSSRLAGPYTVVNSPAGSANNKCYVKINGATTPTTITLSTGSGNPASASRTAAQVVADFNTALSNATVDSPSNNVRVVSDQAGTVAGAQSSVQFTGGTANCLALLGLDVNVHYAMWPGWFYTISGTQYGIANNGTLGDAGWTTTDGGIDFDVPRAFQIWRSTLMQSNALFTTMTGWPYFYMDIGNAMGGDAAPGYPNNVPVPRRPFDGTDASKYFEQTITPGAQFGDTGLTGSATDMRSGGKYIQESDGSWVGLNWLGELYPDKIYNLAAGTDWKDFGNVPTPVPGTTGPTASGTFRRIRRDQAAWGPNLATSPAHTLGTTLTESARRTHEQGMPMFFWQTGNTCVEADSGGTNGNIGTGGTYINNFYNYTLPATIPANRPFQTGAALPGTKPDGYGLATYGAGNTISQLTSYYTSDESGEQASALLAARQGTTNQAMFVVENGLSPSGVSGTDLMAHYAFITLIQSYFEAGLFNGSAAPATAQLPRIMITTPNNNTDLTDATSINITWSKQWLRWDGVKYASGYAAGYSSSAAVSYLIMYSRNNGQTWKYVQDDVAAVPGTRLVSTDPHYVTTQSYAWSTPAASFPTGAYVIRVEAYRNSYPLHYSFHQYMAFINRSS